MVCPWIGGITSVLPPSPPTRTDDRLVVSGLTKTVDDEDDVKEEDDEEDLPEAQAS